MKFKEEDKTVHIVNALCDCGGILELITGMSSLRVATSNEPLFMHRCNRCGATVALDEVYPKISPSLHSFTENISIKCEGSVITYSMDGGFIKVSTKPTGFLAEDFSASYPSTKYIEILDLFVELS